MLKTKICEECRLKIIKKLTKAKRKAKDLPDNAYNFGVDCCINIVKELV